MLHIPLNNLLLLAAKQEPYKKAYLFMKNIEELSRKSSGEWTSRQKKDRTERVIGLGRRTKEKIVKWNQMKALRFQTGGRHQTSLASLRGLGRLPESCLMHLGEFILKSVILVIGARCHEKHISCSRSYLENIICISFQFACCMILLASA